MTQSVDRAHLRNRRRRLRKRLRVVLATLLFCALICLIVYLINKPRSASSSEPAVPDDSSVQFK